MGDLLAILQLSCSFQYKEERALVLLLVTKVSLSARQYTGSQLQDPAAKWTKGEKVNKWEAGCTEHGQTAGHWARLNKPYGSDEMRQEKQPFGEQGINPRGLIGGLACFKGPCCTHLPWPVKVFGGVCVGRLTGLLGVKQFRTCHRLLSHFNWEH